MFQCRSQLLLVNLLKYRCCGVEVIYFVLFVPNMARAIKETIYIRVNNPTLNINIDKYHLPHIWDKVLFSTLELKAK